MFITIFCKYIAKKWKALLVCEDLTIIIQMKYKPLIFGTCRENGGTVGKEKRRRTCFYRGFRLS